MTYYNVNQLVRDKNVIIVGPSPNIIGKGYGEKIDSYDVVIRTNNGYPVDEKYVNDYGSKCDVLYTNNFFTKNCLNEKIHKMKDLKFICSKIPLKYSSVFNKYKIRIRNWNNIKKIKGLTLTGNVIISDMINLKAKSITITGMDFYESEDIYIDNYLPHKLENIFKEKNLTKSNWHNYDKERDIIIKLIEKHNIKHLK